ncbi:hypothetical protein, partial [Gordonia sihwensis]|uniref:hypothetical protein n=1 Tax=Gordonia sihwensis TaxID=173559 RepID=UPI003D965EC7
MDKELKSVLVSPLGATWEAFDACVGSGSEFDCGGVYDPTMSGHSDGPAGVISGINRTKSDGHRKREMTTTPALAPAQG